MMTNELTFPLSGFKPGTRTNVAKGILTNKDAALLILAANGGTLPKTTVQALLRAWRPLEGKSRPIIAGGRYKGDRWIPAVYGTDPSELQFTYLFNEFYGHITSDYNQAAPRKYCYNDQARYSSGPYMWRPARATAAISALGRARLRSLVEACQAAGMVLAPEVLESAAKA